ncbi:MAG: ATP-grasp domain-containing protein [Bacteroidetes bacterium]|jgi:alpha-L-glutamate ligase-like protein|nr:ATP-grasp domain-containing protein [Bacteroidota bacterium]
MLSSLIQKLMPRYNDVVGINERNRKLIYPNNERKHYKFADDKLYTKQILEKNNLNCPKTYAAIGRVGDIQKIWEQKPEIDNLVIKPASGMGGNGIMLIRKRNGRWHLGEKPITEAMIFTHIANIIFGMYSGGNDDRVILEELIVPDPALSVFYKDGIPDIRIITLSDKPVMGMLRLPTSESEGKANLHQGGVGVGIDLDTGTLTYAYDGINYIDTHPDSNIKITGKVIPRWDEIMDLTNKVSSAFPLNYLGIDIVLDKTKGPLVLEINVRPGLSIQMANKIGLRSRVGSLNGQI